MVGWEKLLNVVEKGLVWVVVEVGGRKINKLMGVFNVVFNGVWFWWKCFGEGRWGDYEIGWWVGGEEIMEMVVMVLRECV